MQMKVLFFVVCGILSVKGTPFTPESSIDLFKLNEVQEQLVEFQSNNATLSALNSTATETLEVAKPEENIAVIQGSIIETTLILDPVPIKPEHNHPAHHPDHDHSHGHNEGHVSNNMGPVELGLRNVVSASGIATEELFMEMAALSVETSKTISTKSEILTSQAMNAIFKSLSMAEAEIKKSQECGKQFVNSFNSILGQVDSNLKSCVHNLTIIGENYKNQSTHILSSISMVSDEIQDLPESCEIAENFALGTFCIVNNLAEANTRIVMTVKEMRSITEGVKENISKAALSTVACNKILVEGVLEKLGKLYNEISEKCKQQANPQNKEI